MYCKFENLSFKYHIVIEHYDKIAVCLGVNGVKIMNAFVLRMSMSMHIKVLKKRTLIKNIESLNRMLNNLAN